VKGKEGYKTKWHLHEIFGLGAVINKPLNFRHICMNVNHTHTNLYEIYCHVIE
jgi:hypothetical protein